MARLPKIDNVPCMSAAQLNKALDSTDKARTVLNDEFIAAGRGHERPSETLTKSDPLATRYAKLWDVHTALRRELQLRYGPGAPSRLPTRKGFGPTSRCKR